MKPKSILSLLCLLAAQTKMGDDGLPIRIALAIPKKIIILRQEVLLQDVYREHQIKIYTTNVLQENRPCQFYAGDPIIRLDGFTSSISNTRRIQAYNLDTANELSERLEQRKQKESRTSSLQQRANPQIRM